MKRLFVAASFVMACGETSTLAGRGSTGADSAGTCDSGAEVFMFETWAREAGHEVYALDPAVPDPDALQSILRDAYDMAAEASCAHVAPVGDAWQHVWATHPEVVLYAGDGSHATLAGSDLASCVFAESLLAVDVRGGWIPQALEFDEAMLLQNAAHCVVTDTCSR